jgi:hypothetical protein
MPQQFPILLPFRPRPLRVLPVLRYGPADAIDTCWGLRPRAHPAVKPAQSVWHRGTLARRATPSLSTTVSDSCKVSRFVAISQPSVPPFMGCSLNFSDPFSRQLLTRQVVSRPKEMLNERSELAFVLRLYLEPILIGRGIGRDHSIELLNMIRVLNLPNAG